MGHRSSVKKIAQTVVINTKTRWNTMLVTAVRAILLIKPGTCYTEELII